MPAVGDIITVSPTKNGSSVYLLLSRESLAYMGFCEKDVENFMAEKGDIPIVMVFEKSPRWGQFIGCGRAGVHVKKD